MDSESYWISKGLEEYVKETIKNNRELTKTKEVKIYN